MRKLGFMGAMLLKLLSGWSLISLVTNSNHQAVAIREQKSTQSKVLEAQSIMSESTESMLPEAQKGSESVLSLVEEQSPSMSRRVMRTQEPRVLPVTDYPDPLMWQPGMDPSIHNLFKGVFGQDLDLVLSSAPVLRLKSLENQLQLRCMETVVDMTLPAKTTHNLRRKVRSLQETSFRLKSEFHRQDESKTEFFVADQLMSYISCETVCITKNSKVLSDLGHLKQLIRLYGETKLKHFWIDSIQNQSISQTSYYDASYDLKIKFNGTNITVFPTSDFNNQTTLCFVFLHHEAKKCSDVENLGALTIYYEKHGQEDIFYNRHLYDLSLKVHLNQTFKSNLSNRAILDTDLDNRMEFYYKTLMFETFVPRPANIQKLEMEYSRCICERHSNVTLFKVRQARSTLEEASLILSNLNLGLETVRIKGHGHHHLSSVTEILADKVNENRRMAVDQFIDNDSILPLYINRTDWVSTINTTANLSLVDQWLKNYPNHKDQFQPLLPGPDEKLTKNEPEAQQLLGPLSVLKLLSIGTPYLYEQTHEVIGQLLSEHAGRWIKPDLTTENQVTAAQFTKYINSALGGSTEAQFMVGSDRLLVSFPQTQGQVLNDDNLLDNHQITDFNLEAMRLENLPEVIKDKMPSLLISRLLSEVGKDIVQESSIFVETLESKSFIVFRLYYQSVIPSMVTSYKFYVLPHAQRAKEKYYYQIKNVSVNMERDIYLSTKGTKYDCMKAVMGITPELLAGKCIEKSRVVPVVELALKFHNSFTIKVSGPGVLHYSCRSQPASMYALHDESILFLVHDSCNLHGIFSQNVQYHHKAGTTIEGNFTVIPILRYEIPLYATWKEKLEFVIWTFGIIIAVILVLLFTIGLACWYAKKKLGIRIRRNAQANLELQLQYNQGSRSTGLPGDQLDMEQVELDRHFLDHDGVYRQSTPPVYKGKSLGVQNERINRHTGEQVRRVSERGQPLQFDTHNYSVEQNYSAMLEKEQFDDSFYQQTFPYLEEVAACTERDIGRSNSETRESQICQNPTCVNHGVSALYQGTSQTMLRTKRDNNKQTDFKKLANFANLQGNEERCEALKSVKV